MKKTVVTLLVGTVAAMGVMTGCGNGQGTAKLVTPQDSAAYFLGLSQTMPLHEQWDQYQYQVPGDSASKKDQFIQGFRDALTSGSAKAAYSNGYLMGFQLIDSWEGFNARIPGDSLDKQKFIDGLIAGLSGKVDTTLTMDAINNYMQEYFANAQKIVEDQNKKAGADFLAANKSKDGVVELPSGLQYRIDKLGDGIKPAAEDTVVVHYKGTKLDGTVFDSSYDRGEPATFPLTGVIQGFSEGLQQVPAGSKVTLWIPGELAYGQRGSGDQIGPYELLTFEMELQEVRPAAKK
ncbi:MULTISPECIES: FKBP-type peptidyl-prolyl cis-trans isomerase [Porphyromonas]|uniref:FKBP-type peptidyl-prolyl cis-trans isomerase n=1 Tax=Porphyromonas TaxID=836 RepID=UPI000379F0D3|nr:MULTISPECIES: FKBP-type peptidyl-prolyl cis-trans isomerase [Porphyromonas]MDD7468411.1 FKBP-type peptidyl-prolyl cis-trans isomerase [Bacteroidales bacterium]MDY6101781.1 FKBP-type peptidyl-prolyl cis-trans isomerase [Porphyromonas sp.]